MRHSGVPSSSTVLLPSAFGLTIVGGEGRVPEDLLGDVALGRVPAATGRSRSLRLPAVRTCCSHSSHLAMA